MLEIIQDPLLTTLNSIQHGVFTRKGGVSEGYYSSLNFNYSSGDDPQNVTENRRLAMAHLGYSPESLITTKNTHGKNTVIVKTPWKESEKPTGDGIVTNLKGVVLGLHSADCPIISFVDEKSGAIGLAHAGWKGAIGGIIESTVEQMISIGANLENMMASIGPCIAQNSYEIGQEFYEEFLKDNKNNECYFITKENCLFFDLRAYIKNRLEKSGLKTISSIDIDTFTNEELFFSYRRTRIKGDANFGGHLTFIALI